ncbi:hypothetical protein [Acinetobacter sp. RIT698]|uniref:hypothetical protein n=1 Tax=Acinetobacter sp. RIT698 TaxID=2666192 RepID=UPI002090D9E1|nr:hypothetical protein [Acinetobacter sp. RIT698]
MLILEINNKRNKMSDDFRFVSDIASSLSEFKKLISSNIFNQPQNPFFKSALIHLLILSRDLTHKSYIKGKTIDFTDDMVVTNKINNVTFLIKHARDAVCHIDSDNHVLSKENNIMFTYNVIVGKGVLAQFGDLVMSSDFDDDICIFFGDQKIYLFRHIIRAVKEAESYLKELYKNSEYNFFLSNC